MTGTRRRRRCVALASALALASVAAAPTRGAAAEGPDLSETFRTARARANANRGESVRSLSAVDAVPAFGPGDARSSYGPPMTAVANLRHEGRWWVALFPPDAVGEVVVQRGLSGFGHGQLRFTMKSGREVILVPQSLGGTDPFEPSGVIPRGPFAGRSIDTGRFRSARVLSAEEAVPFLKAAAGRGGAGLVLKDVIASGHGKPPKGAASAKPLGGVEQYLFVFSLWSVPDDLEFMARSGAPHDAAQYRLRGLSDEDKQRVLAVALGEMSGAARGKMFNLATLNCVSAVMDVLDRSLDLRPVRRAAGAVFKRNPRLIPFYLWIRGIDAEPGPSLREEFLQGPSAREVAP